MNATLTSLFQLRLLPALIACGGLVLALQFLSLAEAVGGFTPRALATLSQAAEQSNARPVDALAAIAPAAGDAKDAAHGDGDAKPGDHDSDTGHGDDAANDTGLDPLDMTRTELELLQDLASRRAELDERDRMITVRQRLLEATEQKIDNKIASLKVLEKQLQALVIQIEEQEDAQLQSLVAVYEKMKPKDAARVFEQLDMDIQLSVAQRMKEAKMAPLMAAMSAEKARALTTALAARPTLPEPAGE